MLHDMGIDTGIDLAALIEAARLAQESSAASCPVAYCAPARTSERQSDAVTQ